MQVYLQPVPLAPASSLPEYALSWTAELRAAKSSSRLQIASFSETPPGRALSVFPGDRPTRSPIRRAPVQRTSVWLPLRVQMAYSAPIGGSLGKAAQNWASSPVRRETPDICCRTQRPDRWHLPCIARTVFIFASLPDWALPVVSIPRPRTINVIRVLICMLYLHSHSKGIRQPSRPAVLCRFAANRGFEATLVTDA